jgi:uncharacterized protein involved in exopolysaccharide biosynthesis
MQSPDVISLSLRDILQVIFKRKLLILFFFLGTFCTVTIVTFAAKATYEAKSQFLVKLGRESVYVPEIGGANPVISNNRQNQINSEIEIIKSPSLAKEVVANLGPTTIYPGLGQPRAGILAAIFRRDEKPQDLTLKALQILKSKLDIHAIKDSDIIEARFKHTDPQMAATVLNALANHYLERHLKVHKAQHSYSFFKQQVNYLKDKLSLHDARLQALKAKHNVTSLTEQQRLLLAKTTELRSELDRTRSRIVETQNRIAHLQQQLEKTPKTISQREDVNRNTGMINNLEAQLVALQLRKEQLLTKYTDNSRLVQSVNEEIKIVKQKLAEQESERYGTTHWGVNATYQFLQQELHRSEADLKSLEAKRDIQSTQLEGYHNELGRLNHIELDHKQLQQEVEVDQQNYRLYLTKFEESRISDAMDYKKITSVTLIEPVQVPINPVSPKKSLNLVVGLFLGTVGSLGLAFFLHYLDDSLETIESVENCLDVPVLISIPYSKKGNRKS